MRTFSKHSNTKHFNPTSKVMKRRKGSIWKSKLYPPIHTTQQVFRIISFSFKLCYLFEKQKKRKIPFHQFISQMPVKVMTEPKPGAETQSGSPYIWREHNQLSQGCCLANSQIAESGGQEPKIGPLIQDAAMINYVPYARANDCHSKSFR